MEGAGRGLLERLSRITSTGRFIREIDGLRFIAISAVVLCHLAVFLRPAQGDAFKDPVYIVASKGFFGVQLFFAISGFILVLPFAESRLADRPSPSLGGYYVRRLVRLEPPYFINLLLLAGVLIAFDGARLADLGPHLLAGLAYSHTLVYGATNTINPAAWSLEVEVQFYVVAPFIAWVFRVRNGAARRVLLILLVLAAALISEWIRLHCRAAIRMSLACQVPYFLLGILLADWYLTDFRRSPERSSRWDVVGLLAAAGLGLGLIHDATPRPLLLPLILLMYMAAFKGRLLNFMVCLPWVTTIGGMCYTIYLYHMIVIRYVSTSSFYLWQAAWPFWLNYLVQLSILIAPLVAVCSLLFVYVERPFMRPLRRNAGGSPGETQEDRSGCPT